MTMQPAELTQDPDHLAAWRHRADPAWLASPECSPPAALWIESVCDAVIHAVIASDRLEQMCSRPFDNDHWLDRAVVAVAGALDCRGLRISGRAFGIDLDNPDDEWTTDLVKTISTAATDRANTPVTWDTWFIAHMLWWRRGVFEWVTAREAAGPVETAETTTETEE